LENLDFLFHPSYAIASADIRKTILTLAVQGKLVPQDANDEPAEKLLSEIAKRIGKSKLKFLQKSAPKSRNSQIITACCAA
jgi:hypothetical protein